MKLSEEEIADRKEIILANMEQVSKETFLTWFYIDLPKWLLRDIAIAPEEYMFYKYGDIFIMRDVESREYQFFI